MINQGNNIAIIRNYLKKTNLDIIDLIGIITVLIIKKDVIKKNSDVGEFVNNILKVKFPEYVIRSRTLIAARVSRILLELDDDKIENIKENILKYIDKIDIEDMNKESSTPKKNKKKNENKKLEKWLKGL
ncbi:hypothetical protein EAI89_19105 [Eubacterium sp. am_0171]|uniref:Uncharacterized protein n=1 Tax=Faecalicatena contorta TaxID=39482 RepID=A0A174CJY0_9FIRM|nr:MULTISPECIES: hypothetical protein [Clostridia]MSC85934.1 hypothetical protein [Eubacterium sp. BIOML-A1]MSD08307.1 hypothetical protein [Eubacterium sp. BIOML-A2]RYT12667.1 hypothetical protein EAI89_19105 [Eubacterium sp. am_0171]CUO13257.1 Uncharacterised protein [[Eubacterium] contortum] [Faecalicatena contorta]